MCLTEEEVEKLLSLIHDETNKQSVKLYLENLQKEEYDEYVRNIEEMVHQKTKFELWQENRLKELDRMKRRGATPEEIKEIKDRWVRAGIVDENGELTEPYRKDLK